MTITLEEKIEAVSAKLREEKDPAKYSQLAMRLNLLTAAKKEMDGDEDDDEEDDKAKKSAKKAEEKKAEEKKAEEKKSAKKAEEKHEEEEEEEEEAKKASAALALIEQATGLRGDAAIGATAAVFSRLGSLESQTKALVESQRMTEKASLIASVTKYVPKAQLDWLNGQKLSVVKGFVEQAIKGSPMVRTEEGELFVPKVQEANSKASLPKDVREMIDSAVAVFPPSLGAEAKTKFEAELVRRHLEDQTKARNGAGGTY